MSPIECGICNLINTPDSQTPRPLFLEKTLLFGAIFSLRCNATYVLLKNNEPMLDTRKRKSQKWQKIIKYKQKFASQLPTHKKNIPILFSTFFTSNICVSLICEHSLKPNFHFLEYLASGGNDNKLLIWSIRNDKPIMKLDGHTAAVVSDLLVIVLLL